MTQSQSYSYNEAGKRMAVTLTTAQEAAVCAAIRVGHVGSVEEFLDRAVSGLPKGNEAVTSPTAQCVFEQGLGLFSSPEDVTLLDEVVSLAYEERRRPSKRKPSL